MLFRVNESGILQVFRFYGKGDEIGKMVDEDNLKVRWVYNKGEVSDDFVERVENMVKDNCFKSKRYFVDFDKKKNRYNVYENLLLLNGYDGSFYDAFQSLWNSADIVDNISQNSLVLLEIKAQGGILFKSFNFSQNETVYEGSITLKDGDILCSVRYKEKDKIINKLYLEPSSLRWNLVFHKNLEMDNAIKWLNTFRAEVLYALLEKIIWEPDFKEKEQKNLDLD